MNGFMRTKDLIKHYQALQTLNSISKYSNNMKIVNDVKEKKVKIN